MYKILLLLLCWVNLAAALQVDILKTADHPALNQTEQGIIDFFNEQKEEYKIKTHTAQGQVLLAKQIADKIINNEHDIIITIGTLAAQAFLNISNNAKYNIIYASVSDPVAAGLDQGKYAGVSNYVPVIEQLKFFKANHPGLKKIGTIINPAEINSVKLQKKLIEAALELKLEIAVVTAFKTADIAQASFKLLQQSVDAIFINNDNNALSAISTIVNLARKHSVPVYCSDYDTIEKGVKAVYGADQYQLGKQSASLSLALIKNNNQQLHYVAEKIRKHYLPSIN